MHFPLVAPRSSQMSRKSTWQQQLSRSLAVDQLRDPGVPADSFLLAEVRQITDRLLAAKRPPIRPHTEACDNLLAFELKQLENTFPAREVAVVSCLHVLRYEQ